MSSPAVITPTSATMDERRPLVPAAATLPARLEPIMPDDIRQCLSELVTALNDHDLDRVAAFYTDDYIGEDIAQAVPQHGPQERVKVLASYLRAFPDLHYSAETV